MIKEIFCYILLFVVLYIEPVYILDIKFAYLWKTPVIYALITSILINSKNKHRQILKSSTPLTIRIGYLYSIIPMLTGFVNLGKHNILEFLFVCAQKIFPFLIIHYFFLKFSNPYKYFRLITNFIFFIVSSSIPFILSIMPQLGKQYTIAGIDEKGFTGIFQNAHVASLTMAFCAIILIHNIIIEQSKTKKIIVIFLTILSLTILIFTFARIGIAVFLCSFTTYCILIKKKKYIFIFYSILIILIFLALVSDNKYINAIEYRMMAKSESQNPSDINGLSSGRLVFWETTIDIISERNFFGILFGEGENETIIQMHKKMNMAVGAHNGFLNALASYGILGLIILIILIYSIYSDFSKIKITNLQPLAMSLLSGFIIYLVFQGEDTPIPFLIFLSFSIIGHIQIKNEVCLNEKIQNVYN